MDVENMKKIIGEAFERERRKKLTKPLIKNKKVRKAVRAWAEANDFINEIKVEGLNAGTRFSEGHWSIEFLGYFIYDLKIDSIYTIAELCGEEK